MENDKNTVTAPASPNTAKAAPLPCTPGGKWKVAARTCAPTLGWVILAAASFHAAYASIHAAFLVLIYLFALVQLAQHAKTWRKAFYPGLAVGMLVAIGRLDFFWRIFSGGSIGLWLVFAFWIGLFVALARLAMRVGRARRFNLPQIGNLRYSRLEICATLLIPFLWCGLEYFRSELYYLRFAWLSPAFAFAGAPTHVPLHHVGSYGVGFLLMSVACASAWLWRRSRIQSGAVLLAGMGALHLWGLAGGTLPKTPPSASIRVAAVQMEFPAENEVLFRLNELLRKWPETDLVVLSEYTFTGPVPAKVADWCRKNRRYLIVGGEEPTARNYYNTAFVISPAGEIVFCQVKSVPIQFFKDGLPAPQQALWDSPWGKLGICICYDLSYTRVTDRLVAQGAQALIVPTMDVVDWGERQHQLHARVAPVRAAEYGIPIFRVASSGISQLVDRGGRVVAEAPCPGDGSFLAGTLAIRGPGTLPLDRWLAPFATGITGVPMLWFLVSTVSSAAKERKDHKDLQ